MNHDSITVCPLDCFDACRISMNSEGQFKGDKSHPVTRGYLCPNLNHYHEYGRIQTPRFRGETITMDEALNRLKTQIENSKPHEVLYYRGSGNMGLMQRISEHFFGGFGAVGASGSLCDGAGEAGIIAGREKNYPLSPQMIAQSEVVIVWGKNPHVSHSHLLPFLEGKSLIVIDPMKTVLGQKADLHIQIRPHGDLHLALLLSRFAMIERIHDVEFCEQFASGYEEFYELTQGLRIKATLESIDVTLHQIGEVLSLIEGKKTVILVGTGVQKYRNGDEVLRAIDGFAALMGLFGKEGCGVSFLGNSTESLEIPFNRCTHKVPKPTVDFSKYKTVFVQGANPLSQMPSSMRVQEGFRKADFTVYFGLYENETSQCADLVIPAQNFVEKNDVRSSYGDFSCEMMPRMMQPQFGISEYDLSAFLCREFGLLIEEESHYLEGFKGQIEYSDGIGYRPDSPAIPYAEGFGADEFQFLEEASLELGSEEGFYLLTNKHPRGLNSQFYRDTKVYFHPDAGFHAGEQVVLETQHGAAQMEVSLNEHLRGDSLLIYAGNPLVNRLTPPWISYEGENAVYQETKIKVTKV
jgi:anaerobic selenocysteine-containing dehydrogenase